MVQRKQAVRRRTWMDVTLVFAAAGPAIGGVIAIVLVAIWSGFHGLLAFTALGAVLSYLAGFPPAAIAGAICGLMSPRIHGSAAWLAACACVGGAVSLAIGYLTGEFLVPSLAVTSHAGGMMVGAYGLVGAVAALGCGVIERNARPVRPGKSSASPLTASGEQLEPQP